MHELIKEIRAIAQTGIHYTRDPYDHERYERLIAISNVLYSQTSSSDVEAIEKFFIPEKGYATPKVDLRACVIKDNKVLLVRERSNGKWTLPGGWADQNESPKEGIVREVLEESGFTIKVISLYAIKDRDRHPYMPKYPVSIYKLFFTAEVTGGEPRDNIEISNIDFFDVDTLPSLSEDRVLAVDIIEGMNHYRDNREITYLD